MRVKKYYLLLLFKFRDPARKRDFLWYVLDVGVILVGTGCYMYNLQSR